MEQLINTMLANTQMAQMVPAVKKGESSQKDGFQKLLEQKADTQTPKQEKTDAAQKPQDAQTTQSEGKVQETEQPQQVQPALKNPRELEDQMALAALAVMQAPVVPVEQVLTPEAPVEIVAEEIAPVAAEAVITPEVQEFVPDAPERKETAGVPQEAGETRTVDQSLEEELPQTIEAPEAASETEGRTVEAKVEVREAAPRDVEVTESEDTEEPQDAEVETVVFEDVKAVPVKVGEAPKAEKAEKPVEEQIVPKVREAVQNGETRVEIQLTPENLGKITIEMTMNKEGNLTVQLHAQNRETQSLLSKNTAGLEALLGRETQQEVRVEVPRQEESQRQDLYEQQQEQQRRHQQEQRRKQEASGEDFLQQLRLGLIPLDGD